MPLFFKIIIAFIVIVILIFGFLLLKNQKPKNISDISDVSDGEIIELLKKNEDSNNYMQNFKDFTIKEKVVLTKESILEGQAGQDFKEVYQGLELENNRYLKVELTNAAGDRGMITVIDFENKEVAKAYGLVLLRSEVLPNQ